MYDKKGTHFSGSETHDDRSAVIKGSIPSTLKLQFKVLCVQRNLKMSAVLEKLVRKWIGAEPLNLSLKASLANEDWEEVKGYIPNSLKHQFKILCIQKQVGMGSVLHCLIQEWVQTSDPTDSVG